MNSNCALFDTCISSNGYRSAIVQKDLNPGSVVSCEEPFAMAVFPSHSHHYCSRCLKKFEQEKPGKRCLGGCQDTFYCSRDCQKKDFPIHKYTCKKYMKIVGTAMQQYTSASGISRGDSFPFENFMLGRNVYIKLCLLAGIDVKEKHVDLPLPPNLEGLSEGPNIEMDEKNDHALSMIIAHSLGINNDDGVKLCGRMLRKFKYNNFGIQNSLQTVIGSGVFPRGAILNHSCDPNCILTYEGSPATQIIRIIKPVTEGEELFHSYTDICQPTSVRRSRLMETYNIDCQCERCQGLGRWVDVDNALIKGTGLLSEDDEHKIESYLSTAQRISMDDIGDSTDSLKIEYENLRGALSIQREKLGKYNLEYYKTECLALNTAMLLGCEGVLQHAQAAVDFLSFVCNQFHPLLLLQQMTLSELYAAYGQGAKAREMYKRLVDACKITWGENHEFVYHYEVLLSSTSSN